MAGGNFDINVGKTRPGTYINVNHKQHQSSKGAARGVAVIPLVGYDWGPNEEFIKLSVDSPDACLNKLGRSIYDSNDAMLMVREIFKNAITCYVYIINTGIAAKATTEDGLTVMAAYPGARGNDLYVVSAENVLGGFDVAVYMGTDMVEIYEGVKTYGDLVSVSSGKYVTFRATTGDTDLKAIASLRLEGGDNGTIENSAVTKFLDKVENIRWNTMCFPITETTLQTACIAKINMLRDSAGKYVQAVLPNCKADYEGIINVTNSVILGDVGDGKEGKQLTVAQTCAWVAGATAGASKIQSITAKEYVGAVDIIDVKTNEEAIEAIRNGEFFFSRSDEDNIVVEYDINSLHTFTAERTSDYAKNRIIRVYDSFSEDLRRTFPPNKYNNDPDGWKIMEGIGRGLLNSYGPVANGGDGSIINVNLEDDFNVDKSRSQGDQTFFNVGLQAVDSVEKLYFSVSTR